MRERNGKGRGGRRRSGGDGEPDMFAKQLAEVVEKAFVTVGGEEGASEATPEAPVATGAAPADANVGLEPIGARPPSNLHWSLPPPRRLAVPGLFRQSSSRGP